jgi:hypothetical protein
MMKTTITITKMTVTVTVTKSLGSGLITDQEIKDLIEQSLVTVGKR